MSIETCFLKYLMQNDFISSIQFFAAFDMEKIIEREKSWTKIYLE